MGTDAKNSRLVIQNDGNLELRNPSNLLVWASNSKEVTVKFANQNSGNCLEANIFVYTQPCSKSSFQNWVQITYVGGYSTLMHKASGLYLNDDGSLVRTVAENKGPSQDWWISGSEIINRFTNQALDTNSMGNVLTSAKNGALSQKWSFQV